MQRKTGGTLNLFYLTDDVMRNGAPPPSTEYIRLGFKEYKRMFDISSLGLQQRTADSVNKNNSKYQWTSQTAFTND